jgi:hypothetical protein
MKNGLSQTWEMAALRFNSIDAPLWFFGRSSNLLQGGKIAQQICNAAKSV